MTAKPTTPLWKRLLPTVLGVALLGFLFGVILPRYIDYSAVFRSIGEIDGGEWLWLGVLSIVRFAPEGWVYQAAQPGLTTWRGIQLFLVGETLTNVPPGGLDILGRFRMSRSWGYTAGESTSATISGWVFANASKLMLPIAASLILGWHRIRSEDVDAIAIIALVVVVVGAVVITAILRSDSLVDLAGRAIQVIVRVVGRVRRREPTSDVGAVLAQFRTAASDVLRHRMARGLAAGLLARGASFALILVSVRFIGIDSSVVSTEWVFAAFAVVTAMTVIPIFSMPGLVEVVLIFALGQLAGSEYSDQVTAAVFVYRALTWLMPIPFGAWLLARWWGTVRGTSDASFIESVSPSGTDGEEPTS